MRIKKYRNISTILKKERFIPKKFALDDDGKLKKGLKFIKGGKIVRA